MIKPLDEPHFISMYSRQRGNVVHIDSRPPGIRIAVPVINARRVARFAEAQRGRKPL